MKADAQTGVPKTSERERRKREFEPCRHCGRDVWREQMTRGKFAGEWRSVDIEGKPHKCGVAK